MYACGYVMLLLENMLVFFRVVPIVTFHFAAYVNRWVSECVYTMCTSVGVCLYTICASLEINGLWNHEH